MRRHEPTTIWPTRPMGTRVQQYVRTTEKGGIAISFCVGGICDVVEISRHDARMLARRLTQCLDETR